MPPAALRNGPDAVGGQGQGPGAGRVAAAGRARAAPVAVPLGARRAAADRARAARRRRGPRRQTNRRCHAARRRAAARDPGARRGRRLARRLPRRRAAGHPRVGSPRAARRGGRQAVPQLGPHRARLRAKGHGAAGHIARPQAERDPGHRGVGRRRQGGLRHGQLQRVEAEGQAQQERGGLHHHPGPAAGHAPLQVRRGRRVAVLGRAAVPARRRRQPRQRAGGVRRARAQHGRRAGRRGGPEPDEQLRGTLPPRLDPRRAILHRHPLLLPPRARLHRPPAHFRPAAPFTPAARKGHPQRAALGQGRRGRRAAAAEPRHAEPPVCVQHQGRGDGGGGDDEVQAQVRNAHTVQSAGGPGSGRELTGGADPDVGSPQLRISNAPLRPVAADILISTPHECFGADSAISAICGELAENPSARLISLELARTTHQERAAFQRGALPLATCSLRSKRRDGALSGAGRCWWRPLLCLSWHRLFPPSLRCRISRACCPRRGSQRLRAHRLQCAGSQRGCSAPSWSCSNGPCPPNP